MHDHSLALATATSGMIGGVTRAVAEEMTLSTISMQGFLDVVFYATVSASVGYGVKRLWDAVTERRGEIVLVINDYYFQRKHIYS